MMTAMAGSPSRASRCEPIDTPVMKASSTSHRSAYRLSSAYHFKISHILKERKNWELVKTIYSTALNHCESRKVHDAAAMRPAPITAMMRVVVYSAFLKIYRPVRDVVIQKVN